MTPEKILIVDDSNTDLRVMTAVLRSKGHEIITAMNGDDALEKARREHPRLVFLDVVLPGKNGFQICRDLKAAPETRDIPVILVTSKNQESDRFWGKRQGADEYLTKPWREEDLFAVLEKHL